MKTSDFSYSKVTNLRGPSNSLLFKKKHWGGPSASFQKKLGGGRAPPAPMDGTPMSPLEDYQPAEEYHVAWERWLARRRLHLCEKRRCRPADARRSREASRASASPPPPVLSQASAHPPRALCRNFSPTRRVQYLKNTW